jgi:hypothetical protein
VALSMFSALLFLRVGKYYSRWLYELIKLISLSFERFQWSWKSGIVFWFMILCSLVGGYWHFGGTYHYHL